MEQEFFTYIATELANVFGNSIRIDGREIVGGGCISRSAKLKTSHGIFFLKWNDSAASDLFVREAGGLRELKFTARDELIVPGVILAAEAGEWPGFIVLEFLSAGYSQHQAEKLGAGLAALHHEQDRPFGFHHDNYCGSTPQKNDWNDSWTEFFIRNRLLFLLDLIDAGRGFKTDERKVFDRLIECLQGILPATSKASLIHGDLWSGNYLYTPEGPALIDPAAYYADREMELSMMSLFGGFSSATWDAYQEAFPLAPGWEDRIRIYQLYHLLNHYYLFGGSYGAQALSLAKKFVRG